MKRPTLTSSIFLAALAAGIAMPSFAHGEEAKEKRFAESQYRHDNMEITKYVLSNILQHLKGETTTSADDVAKLAEAMALSAAMAKGSFEKDTRDMKGMTEALPAIWENWQDFATRMDAYAADTAKLAAAAKAGDNIGPAFKQATSHCKSCHDKYRD